MHTMERYSQNGANMVASIMIYSMIRSAEAIDAQYARPNWKNAKIPLQRSQPVYTMPAWDTQILS